MFLYEYSFVEDLKRDTASSLYVLIVLDPVIYIIYKLNMSHKV